MGLFFWVGCQDVAGLSGNIYLFKNRKYFLAMQFIAFDVREKEWNKAKTFFEYIKMINF
jgi:hypothetical protein